MKLLSVAIALLFSFGLKAQTYRIENNEVKPDKQVLFKPGTAELLPLSEAALLQIKNYLDDKTSITLLRVEGHTDNSGDAKASEALSARRAAVVCQKLVQLGVDCNRLLPVAFGDSKPVATNSTPEGRLQNMRIRFVNAAMRGKLIGGMPADGGGQVVENPCY